MKRLFSLFIVLILIGSLMVVAQSDSTGAADNAGTDLSTGASNDESADDDDTVTAAEVNEAEDEDSSIAPSEDISDVTLTDAEEDVSVSPDMPNIKVNVNCLRLCKKLGKTLYTETEVSGRRIRFLTSECLDVCRSRNVLVRRVLRAASDVPRPTAVNASRPVVTSAGTPQQIAATNIRAQILARAQNRWEGLNDAQKERLRNVYQNVQDNDAYKLKRLEGLDSDKMKVLASLDADQIKNIMKLPRAQVQKVFTEYTAEELMDPSVRNQIRQEIQAQNQLKRNNFKQRQVAQQQIEQARQRYLQAKEKYLNARNRYMNARQRVIQNREKIKACFQEGADTEGCEDHLNVSKEFLLNTADSLIAALEKVKEKVEASEDINSTTYAELMEELQNVIAELEMAKDNLEDAETVEDIRAAAAELKELWPDAKRLLKRGTGRLLNSKIGGIIARSEALESRLERIIAKLEEEGIDTSFIDGMMDDFSQKVQLAKDKYELAREKWTQAKTPGEVDDIVREGNEFMKQARDYLEEANQKIRDIIREIKTQNQGSLAIEEAEEEEAEED